MEAQENNYNFEDYKEKLHPKCNESCFYHCTIAGSQPPDCLCEEYQNESLKEIE